MSIKSNMKYGLADLEKKYGRMTMAKFLSSWRLSEELSQKGFAKKLGISAANLCDIEKGRKGVSPKKAHEIGEKLGVSPEYLVKLSLQDYLDALDVNCEVEVKKAAA